MQQPPADILKDTSPTVDLFVVIDTHTDTNISKVQGLHLPAAYYNTAPHVLKVGLDFFLGNAAVVPGAMSTLGRTLSHTAFSLFLSQAGSPHSRQDFWGKGQMGYLTVVSILCLSSIAQSWSIRNEEGSKFQGEEEEKLLGWVPLHSVVERGIFSSKLIQSRWKNQFSHFPLSCHRVNEDMLGYRNKKQAEKKASGVPLVPGGRTERYWGVSGWQRRGV